MEEDLARIVQSGAPVLCLDTCVLLDLLRDPTRDTVQPHERLAGLDLLKRVEADEVVAMVADQVTSEFDDHVEGVVGEATSELRKLRESMARIDAIVQAYGAQGATNLDHLDAHVHAARAVADRWVARGMRARHDDAVTARAWTRVARNVTPSRRGKDSMKDCVVVETYLGVARFLREAGFAAPIVFASSNTKDYCVATKSELKPDLAADFAALLIAFAPNLGAARHLLGSPAA